MGIQFGWRRIHEKKGRNLDEGEWEDMLIRMGALLKDIKALDEVELSRVQPAFSFNPGGEAE